jgi:hypothetical protein
MVFTTTIRHTRLYQVRHFLATDDCTKCGGHLMVDHPTLGLIDVRVGALRNFSFKPTVHLNYAETIFPMRDGLPKLKDFPAAIGGSGEALPE